MKIKYLKDLVNLQISMFFGVNFALPSFSFVDASKTTLSNTWLISNTQVKD